ncbi:MAG TPA: RluA family pseudouridine synthase [Candidatus Limnocylindria bacterium]|nr:RluA family pseudouridine synthase [Candidatus Limnocylindria bacterium]
MPETESLIVEESHPGERLDRFLAGRFPEVSRSRFNQLIGDYAVLVNDKQVKPTYQPRVGDHITVTWPVATTSEVLPEEIPLEVLFEDDDLIVLNKQAELVVHPAVGHANGTLVNALLHYCKGRLSGIGGVERPGIVHRLDLGTSGCIVVAKNDFVHNVLAEMFASRRIEKMYQCIVIGAIDPANGDIQTGIERHPVNRHRMRVAKGEEGRMAWTTYELQERLVGTSFVQCHLHTGRTHQIRVHMAHIGFPLLGDELYGARANARYRQDGVVQANRQMLHARKLAFRHPRTSRFQEFNAPLPEDFKQALAALRPEGSTAAA